MANERDADGRRRAVDATAARVCSSALAGLSPASFGMVMATGIVAIAAQLSGLPRLAHTLFALSVVMYAVLCVLTLWRLKRHRQRFIDDLFDHLRGPGFFTTVAATSLLGSQFLLLAAHDGAGLVMWALALVRKR